MDLLIFIGVSLAFIAGITVVERWRNPVQTDWRVNLQSWVINTAIGAMFAQFWPHWRGASLIDAATLPLWLALPAYFLVRDFLEWFYHYAQHRVGALWAIHSLHHSDPEMCALTIAAVSLYHYFVHSNLRVDFGRWSWLLNSPAYHRRHHSRLPEHYDANLAALFPIWDVLFGFYRRPDGWPPCGLDEGKPENLTELVAWPVRGRKAAAGGTSGEA